MQGEWYEVELAGEAGSWFVWCMLAPHGWQPLQYPSAAIADAAAELQRLLGVVCRIIRVTPCGREVVDG